MKSRLTTYMLLAAAIAVWGAIAWKLLSPDEDIPPAAPHAEADDTECEPVADTLFADYPDPFLKTSTPQTVTPAKPMRVRQIVKTSYANIWERYRPKAERYISSTSRANSTKPSAAIAWRDSFCRIRIAIRST